MGNAGIRDNYVEGDLNVYIYLRSTTNQRCVFNATGETIRIYYNVEKMQSGDILTEGSKAGQLVFKEDSSIPYVSILANDAFGFGGEGISYASIYVEGSSNACEKTISENYEVPSDKSFIVTADLSIKFQKAGASTWEDEDGIEYGQQN